MLLGAGRARLDTAIDLGVGLTVHAKIGDKVEQESPLVTIHFNDPARAEEAAADIRGGLHNRQRKRVAPPALHQGGSALMFWLIYKHTQLVRIDRAATHSVSFSSNFKLPENRRLAGQAKA